MKACNMPIDFDKDCIRRSDGTWLCHDDVCNEYYILSKDVISVNNLFPYEIDKLMKKKLGKKNKKLGGAV